MRLGTKSMGSTGSLLTPTITRLGGRTAQMAGSEAKRGRRRWEDLRARVRDRRLLRLGLTTRVTKYEKIVEPNHKSDERSDKAQAEPSDKHDKMNAKKPTTRMEWSLQSGNRVTRRHGRRPPPSCTFRKA